VAVVIRAFAVRVFSNIHGFISVSSPFGGRGASCPEDCRRSFNDLLHHFDSTDRSLWLVTECRSENPRTWRTFTVSGTRGRSQERDVRV
jgi:hypothetical protein